jgi:hypothetical protein
MNSSHFDAVIQQAGTIDRKTSLKMLGGSLAAIAAAHPLTITAKKKKKKKKKQPAARPRLVFTTGSFPITDPGVLGVTPQCPDGFVAIGGSFDAAGVDLAGLVESRRSPNDPGTWWITVRTTNNPGPNAVLDYGAVCLEAEIVV